MENYKIFGLILSAGLSGRMRTFKPLLQYNGKSFIAGITEKLSFACQKVIVVTGFNSGNIVQHLENQLSAEILSKVIFVHNENYKSGMFSSLKKGIRYCTDLDWVLYHFVDQPTLPFEFYTKFIKQIDEGYDWIQPVKEGKKGHPLLIGEKVIERINAAGEDSNLREITRTKIIKKYWECEYKEIFDDIDTIDDYNNL